MGQSIRFAGGLSKLLAGSVRRDRSGLSFGESNRLRAYC